MKKLISVFALLLVISLACHGREVAGAADPSGNWMGALDVGSLKLRLALKITRANDAFTGTFDSVDQGATGIPITKVAFQNPDVELEIKSIAGSFKGTLNEDGSTLSGQWKQGGRSFPLTFSRTLKRIELLRPQVPKKPYPYREQMVTITNPGDGVKLAGTLTLPPNPGLSPAVILITGSGPQDRDEAIMGHRPFLVLADFLTRQGIAVLRLDDRGVGGSTGNLMNATDDHLAGDTLAAVAWLKQQRDIDPQRIGLIGHSEGGIIAPLAAGRAPAEIAFMVLMAGPGVPMNELLETQAVEMARANGVKDGVLARIRQFQSKCFEILNREPDDAVAETALRTLWEDGVKNLTSDERKELGLAGDSNDYQIKIMLTPWFRQILKYDPKSALAKIRCPVLALNGEKDLQVSSKENLGGIAAALKAGRNPDFQTIELSGLNHLFQTCKSGLPKEYGEIEETISPEALKHIADWIHRHSGHATSGNQETDRGAR